jgi:hypothetical protein
MAFVPLLGCRLSSLFFPNCEKKDIGVSYFCDLLGTFCGLAGVSGVKLLHLPCTKFGKSAKVIPITLK